MAVYSGKKQIPATPLKGKLQTSGAACLVHQSGQTEKRIIVCKLNGYTVEPLQLKLWWSKIQLSQNKFCIYILDSKWTYKYMHDFKYSKTSVKRPLSKRPKIGFKDQLSLNAGQKYCRMLQGEDSVMLSTFIKLPFVNKTFVLSIFEWPFYTGFLYTLSKTYVVGALKKRSSWRS